LEKLENREIRLPRHHPELEFLTKTNMNMSGWKFEGLMDQGRKA
jgi:hypothetical protein